MVKDAGSLGEIRKKITKTHELISTSYHEAGHTIFALLHFMQVSSVSVFENKKLKRIHGATCYNHPADLDSIPHSAFSSALANTEVGMRFAGLIAETIFFKSISGSDQVPSFITDGSDEDIEDANKFIKKYNVMPFGKRSDYKKKISKEVQSELINNWNAITVIAHGLFRRHKLSFADLQKLLTTKTSNKKFWKVRFRKLRHYYDGA